MTTDVYTPGYAAYCECLALIAYARSEYFWCDDCYIPFNRALLACRA
jgi:hypothetical protein